MAAVVFRCDASPQIGYGHLMRSVALAECVRRHGDHVMFLSREDPRAARTLQEAVGVPAGSLAAGRSLEDVLDAMRSEVERCRGSHAEPPWVVIDTYEQTARQIAAAREAGARVLVIDDLGGPAADAHLLVNPNLDACASWYPDANGTRLLLGASYALLRKEFLLEERRREPSAPMTRLLVTLGGSDRRNRLVTVLNGLAELPLKWRKQLELAVVLGPGYRHADEARALAGALGDHATIHTAIPRMSELMTRADLAVSAAGSTVYELAHLGVPMVTVTLADNQARNAEAFARHGLSVSLGPAEHLEPSAVAQAVLDLLEDPKRRAAMSARARAAVDGLGCERIYQAMTN